MRRIIRTVTLVLALVTGTVAGALQPATAQTVDAGDALCAEALAARQRGETRFRGYTLVGPTTAYSGESGPQAVLGTEGSDVLDGGTGNDLLCGFAGDDTQRGGSGNDILAGGPGADELEGGTGGDTLYADQFDRVEGGTGNNRVIVVPREPELTPEEQCLAEAAALGYTGPFDVVRVGTEGDDRWPGEETAELFCGYGRNDQVDTLGAGDVFLGGDGVDIVRTMNGGVFEGGTNRDAVLTMTGGVFEGGEDVDGINTMTGGTFNGGAGEDGVSIINNGEFNGGEDIDIVFVMNNGTFNGGERNDRVQSMNGADAFFDGGAGEDTVDTYVAGTCANVEVGNCPDRSAGIQSQNESESEVGALTVQSVEEPMQETATEVATASVAPTPTATATDVATVVPTATATAAATEAPVEPATAPDAGTSTETATPTPAG